MLVHDDLGNRMKTYYENIPKSKLMRRTPVIIRIDGKCFHSFAKSFKKPFDHVLISSMQETMKYLCENIQGCVLGYTQSDEISLLLIDYKKLNSAAWFDNEVMKICSVSASMATMYFNKVFRSKVMDIDHLVNFYSVVEGYDSPQDLQEVVEQWDLASSYGFSSVDDVEEYTKVYNTAINKGAMFDSRCFNIPKEEVVNYFYWRQLDATRNSIEMVGHANFSTKELYKKSCSMIQDMLHEQKGINWNDFTVPEKRGSCCIKETYLVDSNGEEYDENTGVVTLDMLPQDLHVRTRWVIDKNIPIFKSDGREYIDKLIEPEE